MRVLLCLLTLALCVRGEKAAPAAPLLPPAPPGPAIDVRDLIVHDPAILADTETQTYYVYAQYSPKREWLRVDPKPARAGVIVYTSRDLTTWSLPQMVFTVPEGFWADPVDAPWAPEVHAYRGKYYLFVTFNDWKTILEERPGRPPITRRASQILVADSPLGPFRPFANRPHTPPGEMTLDATFWEEAGQPWMIYCQEWIQTTDGLVKAIRLTADLSATEGTPITLIRAGEVPWTKREIAYRNQSPSPGIVTDGPWLHRLADGTLALLWSSWSRDRQYATSFAYARSGKLAGPWVHEAAPVLQDDRGHGAIFRTFDGALRLVVHRYFRQPATRLQIWDLREEGGRLVVGPQLWGTP